MRVQTMAVATMDRDQVLAALAAAGSVELQVSLLAAGLSSPDGLVRQTCAIRLGFLGARADGALEPLLEVARDDEHARVRSWAAFALARLGCVGPGVAILVGLLGHERLEVRGHAAIALSALGPQIPEYAVARLVAQLGDDSENVRWALCLALGEMGASARASLPALAELRRDVAPPVRLAAATAIRKIRL